jgi:hypothetical protein
MGVGGGSPAPAGEGRGGGSGIAGGGGGGTREGAVAVTATTADVASRHLVPPCVACVASSDSPSPPLPLFHTPRALCYALLPSPGNFSHSLTFFGWHISTYLD